jgi:hypothetical protein
VVPGGSRLRAEHQPDRHGPAALGRLGSSYTTLAASAGYTFNPATGNTATVTFPAADVRYVMLTFTANTGWPAGQLSELQVYSS